MDSRFRGNDSTRSGHAREACPLQKQGSGHPICLRRADLKWSDAMKGAAPIDWVWLWEVGSHGMFSMPRVRNVVALRKPTAQNPCRGYPLSYTKEGRPHPRPNREDGAPGFWLSYPSVLHAPDAGLKIENSDAVAW